MLVTALITSKHTNRVTFLERMKREMRIYDLAYFPTFLLYSSTHVTAHRLTFAPFYEFECVHFPPTTVRTLRRINQQFELFSLKQ